MMKVCLRSLTPHQKQTSWLRFPLDMLTPEVRTNISSVVKHIRKHHILNLLKALCTMKKLIMTIPVGTFWLLLQAMVQPCIMIQHQQLCQIRSGEAEKHHTASLVDMVPDGHLSKNLPNPVRTLAAILHYQIKNETEYQDLHHSNIKTVGCTGEVTPPSIEGSML